MARKPNHQFEKRKREQARAERAEARRRRKEERATASADTKNFMGEDPDLAGIVVGPQPTDEISKAEAKLAVERAMNPGKIAASGDAGGGRTSKVFVGNLDFDTEEKELESVFKSAGFTVDSVSVVRDRDTGQSRGFAFVEIQGMKEGTRAASQLDGTEVDGRQIRVNMADKPGRR